jgi:RHS repeat-associated protein
MDSLNYFYNGNTNRLNHISDSFSAGTFDGGPDHNIVDIDGQPDNNYTYDAIGNLIKDSAEKITSIKWNVYGKIEEINREATTEIPVTNIKYSYDALGNRISQEITTTDNKYYTWYVRDAQGNILSTYTAEGTDDLEDLNLKLSERFMYGSSRLGTMVVGDGVNDGPDYMQYYSGNKHYDRGEKQYELTNHLGNVLATISDRKFGIPLSDTSSLISYYEPDIVNAQDYYPFGMMSRAALRNTDKPYKFGFNGKLNDNEVKGLGLQQDYGMRIYDPRVGRFLSVDPIARQYPELTPYQFASNTPIQAIDLDGEEAGFVVNWLADKAKAMGSPKLSTYIRSFGGDPWYNANQLGKKILQGDFKGAAVQVAGYMPAGVLYNLGKTGVEAANGDGNAQAHLAGVGTQMLLGHVLMGGGVRNVDPAVVEDPVAATTEQTQAAHSGNESVVEANTATTENTSTSDLTGIPEWNGPLDYSHLKEPRVVAPGLDATRAQRARMLEYNKKMNGGVIKSDESGAVLNKPVKNTTKGQKADMNQAEIDHKVEKVKGGTNSNKNLRVISKQENVDKEANRKKE